MIVAAGISYVMADPFVAIASLAAFTFSELADWTIYTFTKKEFKQRVLISSAVATPVDSVIFLTMIGHFSITGAVLMTASKMIGALVVWRMVR
jgi:uncharacterized PurR-regulated membrane protein YhhQ (DUF165 family)